MTACVSTGAPARLQAELERRGLHALLVPHGDEYQNKFLPAANKRLAYVTGFTGSAGLAIITRTRAALFIDGRYTLQAELQAPHFERDDLAEEVWAGWIRDAVRPGEILGYDPRVLPEATRQRLAVLLAPTGIRLQPTEDDLVAAIWTDRPAAPVSPAVPHPLEFAGREAAGKRAELAAALKRMQADATILAAPDQIAWLLNLRGGDVPNTPLALATAILAADGSVDLYIDRRKITDALRQSLGNQVALHDEGEFGAGLARLTGKRVHLDPTTCSAWVVERLSRCGAELCFGQDLALLPRAQKNAVERDGARDAHLRDGVALVRFLHWLDRASNPDELRAAETLLAFRSEDTLFRGESFPTIAASGPNAALAHYRPDRSTNRKLRADPLFLIDSGAQYLSGTTDVTRTVALSTPSAEIRDRFTRVLQAHIALATVRFPAGTSGLQLDAIARRHLWDAGLDYGHGTGHGVGSYLLVQEGPQRFATQAASTALLPGMMLSDEPGYYKKDAYGIRIENLLLVRDPAPVPGGEHPMLSFEVLTLAPIDRSLIDRDRLSRSERGWIDAYHARVLAELTNRLPADTRDWLARATRPL